MSAGPLEHHRAPLAPGPVFYSLCGVMLLAAAALMFAPIVHRLMHRFHLESPRER